MIPAVERGQIRPVIDSTLPLSRPDEIAARLRSGQAAGKVVVAIDD